MFKLSKLANILMLTAIPLWGGAVLSACSSDKDEPEPNTETSKKDPMVHITMTIQAGSPSTTTESRVSVGGDATTSVKTGSRDENYINLDNVRIYLYSVGTDSWGGVSMNSELIPTTKEIVNESKGEYLLNCDVPKETLSSAGSFRVAVFANWEHETRPMYANKYNQSSNYLVWNAWLNDGDYSYNYGTDSDGNTTYFEPSTTTPIPMYGVLLVSNYTEKLKNGDMLDLGVIYMIRAMAKIIVIDEDAKTKGTAPAFDQVTLSKCLNRGVCMPNNVYDQAQATEANPNPQNEDIISDNTICVPGGNTKMYKWDADCTTLQINSVNVGFTYPSKCELINDLPLKRINAHEFVAYVPEYEINHKYPDGVTFATPAPELDISAYGTKYVVEFKDYENGVATGNAFNILRNHIYEYHVSITNQTVISYVVKKWDEYNSDTIEFE